LARLSAKEQVGTLPHPKAIRSLSWVAYFAPPASWSEKRKRAALGKRHMSKPDKDNLEKEILDSLFEDDSAISDGASSKRWGLPPRVEITIDLEE
jgi:Holliday junction resolvase RusA-like endonuclease